jgi:multidrug efflux pump subunit AcrA (membrane-fusion protein)
MFEADNSYSVDNSPPPSHASESPILKYVLLALAIIYVIGSLYLIYTLKTRLDALDQKQQTLEAAQAELGSRLHATSSEFRQALSSEVGLTKQEMAKRAAQLEQQQKAAAAKLSAAQSQQGQQIAAVTGEVSGVKTELGGAKTDIQKTQTDLAATNQKLERAIGDLGVQSGLIAHTAGELDVLKHKGDRNYYDFTLNKGAKTPVSTVSLQLKKVDAKKSRFTLNVIADDRTIEKKDRTVGEPLQFYTGRDKLLYEVVVFTANKNSITGYLATPKNAPTPITP